MGTDTEIEELRKKFIADELNEKTVSQSPFEQFDKWYQEALISERTEPTAMVVSTASRMGVPSVRTVLLKMFDTRGFVFFTNYESRKAKELIENPRVAALFLWKDLTRQVRIMGSISKTTEEENEHYFRSRPKESQLGAWASHQSTTIPNREHLTRNYERYEKQFAGKEVPLPPFWGGYRINPTEFEFWQGRDSRLHDRICYSIKGYGWHIYRLSP
jgi:pyridoxamine 5'-phosphate oxidase